MTKNRANGPHQKAERRAEPCSPADVLSSAIERARDRSLRSLLRLPVRDSRRDQVHPLQSAALRRNFRRVCLANGNQRDFIGVSPRRTRGRPYASVQQLQTIAYLSVYSCCIEHHSLQSDCHSTITIAIATLQPGHPELSAATRLRRYCTPVS